MNPWIKKSIKLANSRGYLDDLYQVYPVEVEQTRIVPTELIQDVRSAYKSKDKLDLLKSLLELPRFPIDDPYIAALRKHPHLLEHNPKTISRLGNKLFSLGIENLISLSAKPQSASRKMGPTFKNWLKTLPCPFVDADEFVRTKRAAFLSGGDAKLKDFAKNQLGIRNLKKGFDFLLKIKRNFFLGEAKFLTDYGGTQNNQFNSALEVAKVNKPNIKGLAVLDGVVWFDSKNYMHKKIKSFSDLAMSSLLLEKFIKSF